MKNKNKHKSNSTYSKKNTISFKSEENHNINTINDKINELIDKTIIKETGNNEYNLEKDFQQEKNLKKIEDKIHQIENSINDDIDNIDNITVDNKTNNNTSIIFIILFIIGISVMLYPFISNFINSSKHNSVINNYTNQINNTSNSKRKEMLLEANEYNSNMKNNTIKDVFSTDKELKDTKYDNLLKITKDGLMGYIEIPKINIKLPIYHGTNEEELNKGVGHFKGSSLPVGGIGTHSILAAHRGLPSSKLFTDLDKVEIGDKFYITILDEKLVYEIDNIEVVKPNDLSLLEIDDTKDYITLVTCTPYAVNTHRLLVRGKRTTDNISNDEVVTKNNIYMSDDDKLLIACLSIIFIIIVIGLRKGKKNKNEN